MCRNICVNGTVGGDILSRNCIRHFKNDFLNPVIRIHKGSIRVVDFSQVDVQVLDHHLVEMTCECCRKRLLLYASKSGAFCQFQQSLEKILCGSLPIKRLYTSFVSQTLPKSMRPLFTTQDIFPDKFTIEPPQFIIDEENLEKPSDQDQNIDHNADFDLMFSCTVDPIVGSYADLGKFTQDNDYLVF